MLLRAGILLAFIVTAHAQPPRSPVLDAIASSSTSAPLPELIKALDSGGKTRALAGLDRLDLGRLDAAALAELSEAYRLLGRPEDALKAAGALSSRDAGSPAGDAQTILALTQAGDYAAAQAAAEIGLKRFPGDKNLIALLHQVKGRTAAAATVRPAEFARPSPAQEATSEVPDNRPARLAVKMPKSSVSVPEPARDAEPLQYVPGGAHKLTLAERLWSNAHVLYAMAFPGQDAKDIADMSRMRKALDRSETGRAVVAELGGWPEIEKTVDLRMATLPGGMGGLTIPSTAPDTKGRRAVLLMSRQLMNEADAVTASVLAHELRHVADFKQEGNAPGLALPSEYAAHRVQVRSFLEITANMPEAEKKSAAGRYLWEYSNFIADLWVDHILSRFPDSDKFKNRFANRKIAAMAADAYADLDASRVAPGSAQLDYHLNAPDRGMYALLTDEKDIVNILRDKKTAGAQPTAEESEALKRRNAMMARMDRDDDAYRRLHGLALDGK